MLMRTVALAVTGLFAVSCEQAEGAPDIHVEAWARPSVAGQRNGAAYATISNRGDGADRLVAAAAPEAARMAMLHSTTVENGVARMRMIEGLDVPAHGQVAMTPGATHIMLIGLHRPLQGGDSLRLRLTFAKSRVREVQASVDAAGTLK